MQNIFIDILPPWVETGLQPAFYDLESGTVLQQTARMYAKVRELTEAFNQFSEDVSTEINNFEHETNTEIERFEQATNDEIERFEGVINDTVEEYIEKFNDLHDYVEDYFDNLDVQEEINNKLDDMVEQGTLQEIITTYIQSNVAWTFDSVAELKLATNLTADSYAQTYGYYTVNDGGRALYKIRTKTEADVIDEGSLVAVYDNTLVAELIYDDYVKPEQFGAYGDGVHDDSTAIINAIACSDVEGNLNKTYYVTQAINVNDKNLKDLHFKAEPFEVSIGNTYYRVLNLTGNNNLYNVSVESEFEYIPSIEIYADPSSTTGLASNVQAFFVTAGVTNFYDCKCDYCWAFNVSSTGSANIYNFIGTNLEMSIFISSSNPVRVYDSKFTINKLINSIYYHHIYAMQDTDSEFNNCEFTETGTGNIGNHYHGYSTSFTSEMSVNGKLHINNCKLVTSCDVGQINAVNLYVNGGSVEGNQLLISGNLANKPTGSFKDCDIKLNNTGNNPISRSKLYLKGCHVVVAGGTKYFSPLSFKVYDSVIDIPTGTFGNQVEATSEAPATDEIVLSNTIINAKTFSWCYPYYANNVKFINNTFNLNELKSNTNPTDRSTTGFMYNCVFTNWTLPFNGDSSNTLKYEYIADGVKVTNIS